MNARRLNMKNPKWLNEYDQRIADLGVEVGLSHRNIAYLIAYYNPDQVTMSQLENLAGLLNTSVGYLLTGEEKANV